MKLIGSGGESGGKTGGGQAKSPTIEKDNLSSTQYANLLDVLCEGEILGLVNGNKSIYFNDTQLQNDNGSYNFRDVSVFTRTGTSNQAPISFYNKRYEVALPTSVGTVVSKSGPVTVTTTNLSTNAVRIIIGGQSLQEFKDNGDIVGSSFQFNIKVKYANEAGFNTVFGGVGTNEGWIKARSEDEWTRDFRIELTGQLPAQIRLERDSIDSTNPSKIFNEFRWISFSEIIYGKFTYPYSALVGTRINAEQFSSIPTRKFDIYAKIVSIPTNATVDMVTHPGRLTYSGIWDGTFKAGYTNDPVWCLYDLLITNRYGFGDQIPSSTIDKFLLYGCSQYCNELVPNGLGGMEPRFSCNVNIQTQKEAYELISEMTSVFRGMAYINSGSITIAQDKPSDPLYLFNQTNVADARFNYSSSSLKSKPTVVTAAYFDIQAKDVAFETAENRTLIEQYGVVKKDVTAFACTSRAQARRVAEWILYSEWYESEILTFKASLDAGVMVRPGMVIQVADPARVQSGQRYGGRIASATPTTVVVDNADGLPASMTGCTFTLIMPNGVAETRPIASRSGTTITFAAGSAFSTSANPQSPWNLSEPVDPGNLQKVQPTLWRVLGAKESNGIEYDITAISYDPSKYNYIELNKPLEFRNSSNLSQTPAAPTNVSANEVMYVERARAKTKILVSWKLVPGATSYVLRWRADSDNWQELETIGNDGQILESRLASYEIEVFSVGANLKRSTTSGLITFAAQGNSRPPATPSGLVLTTVDVRTLLLRWAAPEPDVTYGGIVQVRHSPLTTGASWTSSSTVLEVDGGALQTELPAMTGTYLVKFRDSAGNWSTSAASIASIYTTPAGRVTVLTLNEISDYNKPVPFVSGPFSSRKDGVTVSGGALSLASGSLTGAYYLGISNRSTTSPLYGQDVIDLGTVEDIYIKEAITATLPDGVTAQLFVSTTDGSGADPYQLSLGSPQYTLVPPALQPAWTDWREAKHDYVRGRCFRFKLVLTRTSAAVNASITAYSIDLQMQTRTAGGNQTVATLAYNPINGITLPQYFPVPDSPFSGFHYAIDLSPSFVQITGGGGTATGMTAQVLPSTVYSKNIAYIQFRNGSNQITTPATFTWTVTGYGAENGTPIVSDDSSGAMTPAQMRKLDGLTPGTQATNIVQLDTAAKLPAVDGSQLLNIPGGTFTQGGAGAITQTVQAKVRNTVHVKDFGAVGNGTTDDTAAIQAAINYAQTLTGGTAVWFDGGNYRVTATLTVSVERILLRGSGGTRITRNTNFGYTLRFYNASRTTSDPMFNVGVRDIEFVSTGNMSNSAHLQMVACRIGWITGVTVTNGFAGIELLGCGAININDIYIQINKDPITNGQPTTFANFAFYFGYGGNGACGEIFMNNINIWVGYLQGVGNPLVAFANYGIIGASIDGLWMNNVHVACSKLANFTFGNLNGTPVYNIYANNCMSDHNLGYGVDLVGTSTIVALQWNGRISGLGYPEGVGFRVIAPCFDIQFSGLIDGFKFHGIYISNPNARDITISNFAIRGCNSDNNSDGDGIRIGQGKRIAISNGVINGENPNTGSIVQRTGINLLSENSYSTSQVNISNVIISRNVTGFSITNIVTDVSLSDVRLSDNTTNFTTNGNLIPRLFVSNCPGISPLFAGSVWTPGTIGAGGQAFISLTATGAAVGDWVSKVSFDQSMQGCILSAWVESANTVVVIIQNQTGVSKTFATGTVVAEVSRRLTT